MAIIQYNFLFFYFCHFIPQRYLITQYDLYKTLSTQVIGVLFQLCQTLTHIHFFYVSCPHWCQTCVICKQSHGSCTSCCKCATYFHVMCASRMGYSMAVSMMILLLMFKPVLDLKLLFFLLNLLFFWRASKSFMSIINILIFMEVSIQLHGNYFRCWENMLILFKCTVAFYSEEGDSNNADANILCSSQV